MTTRKGRKSSGIPEDLQRKSSDTGVLKEDPFATPEIVKTVQTPNLPQNIPDSQITRTFHRQWPGTIFLSIWSIFIMLRIAGLITFLTLSLVGAVFVDALWIVLAVLISIILFLFNVAHLAFAIKALRYPDFFEHSENLAHSLGTTLFQLAFNVSLSLFFPYFIENGLREGVKTQLWNILPSLHTLFSIADTLIIALMRHVGRHPGGKIGRLIKPYRCKESFTVTQV